MRAELERKLEPLRQYPHAVQEAIMEASGDTELIDVLGTVMSNTRIVNEKRRGAQEEVAPTANERTRSGELYTIEVSREAKRTFSTPALLTTLQAQGHTIMDLVDAGVVELTWKWTPLSNFAKARGYMLRKTSHEIPTMGEPDGPHIGEYWVDGAPRWT